eukprot:TRINITY_DN3071_c0_g2_i1.p1 TRINITY_DN3071_c0_g2~~TRINITY_DN3071_c0_g2_i1.p1  ORF type:complete len:471 (+),score=127.79 TRINITY_DN3071_c0_g2_i1:113-1525(+)
MTDVVKKLQAAVRQQQKVVLEGDDVIVSGVRFPQGLEVSFPNLSERTFKLVDIWHVLHHCELDYTSYMFQLNLESTMLQVVNFLDYDMIINAIHGELPRNPSLFVRSSEKAGEEKDGIGIESMWEKRMETDTSGAKLEEGFKKEEVTDVSHMWEVLELVRMGKKDKDANSMDVEGHSKPLLDPEDVDWTVSDHPKRYLNDNLIEFAERDVVSMKRVTAAERSLATGSSIYETYPHSDQDFERARRILGDFLRESRMPVRPTQKQTQKVPNEKDGISFSELVSEKDPPQMPVGPIRARVPQPALGKPKLAPIILVPSVSSLINAYNVKKFLEEGKFISTKDAMVKDHGIPTKEKVTRVVVHPVTGRETTVEYEIRKSAKMMRGPDWDRVVCVFASGRGQFKGSKYVDPVPVFEKCAAFYLKFKGDPTPEQIEKWRAVSVLEISRLESERLADAASMVRLIWERIDRKNSPF